MIYRHRQMVLAACFVASTISLYSCGSKEPEATVKDPETTPTQVSHNHRIINSQNGSRQYRMETPLLERYELAKQPFMEFPEGIKVETFADSTMIIESDLVADYARLNETTQVWEARGNVVAHNYTGANGGRTLFTEHLFWDQTKKKIYSDTTAKVIDGGSVHIGRNFEADENFETWSFHNTTGKIEFDPTVQRDSTASAVATDTSVAIVPATPLVPVK